jgi:uncharacterized protein HemY
MSEQLVYLRSASLDNLLERVNDALKQGNFINADQYMKEAEMIQPQTVESYFCEAVLRFRQKDYTAALAALQEAQKLEPGNATINQFMAQLKALEADSEKK